MKRRLSLALALVFCLAACLSPALAAHSPEALLKSIAHLAEEGGILNCEFLLEDSFSDLTDEYGRPDRDNYVKSAHGNYATFSRDAFVVGHTNQEQIFELRSYSRRLSAISERNVIEYFGDADHTASSGEQRIVSYVLPGGYHLKFVFDGKSGDAALNHYNIIWMDGTANERAGDEGRSW